MEKIATHDGIVTQVTPGALKVQMHVVSACSSCEAHAHCGFAESRDKVVDIETPDWNQYQVGDAVQVVIRAGRGLLAVLIAYILPAVLLLAVFISLSLARLPEVWVALITLLAVALYGGVLYLCRNKIQRHFTMSVTRRQPSADPS